MTDYEVETVDYCDDALAVLSHQPFSLMLLLSLHSRWRTWPTRPTRVAGIESGIELLKQMQNAHIQVSVLVISASTLAQAKEEALANGAFAFIPAPLDDVRELDRLVALALSHDEVRR